MSADITFVKIVVSTNSNLVANQISFSWPFDLCQDESCYVEADDSTEDPVDETTEDTTDDTADVTDESFEDIVYEEEIISATTDDDDASSEFFDEFLADELSILDPLYEITVVPSMDEAFDVSFDSTLDITFEFSFLDEPTTEIELPNIEVYANSQPYVYATVEQMRVKFEIVGAEAREFKPDSTGWTDEIVISVGDYQDFYLYLNIGGGEDFADAVQYEET